MKHQILRIKMTQFIMLIFIMLSYQESHSHPSSNLTFRYNHGRLGDVLLNYLKNYYISELYNLKLCISKEIPYLQDFTLSDYTQPLTREHTSKKQLFIRNPDQINTEAEDLLYVSDYNLLLDFEYDREYYAQNIEFNKDYYPDLCADYLFEKSIKEPFFGAVVKKLFKPKKTYHFDLPTDITTVALHIRQPSKDDLPLYSKQYKSDETNQTLLIKPSHYHDKNYPFKFPPVQYYIDQLMFLDDILGNQPLYVFIFSDGKKTDELVERIQEELWDRENIILDYREERSNDSIEDSYCMSLFDYLIRSRSHYSWISQIIGNHKGIIVPNKGTWKNDYLDITESILIICERSQKEIIYTTLNKNKIQEQ